MDSDIIMSVIRVLDRRLPGFGKEVVSELESHARHLAETGNQERADDIAKLVETPFFKGAQSSS